MTSSAGRPIRVLIVDDQAMVRQGFTVLLGTQPDIEVVGEAKDGEGGVAKAAETAPDVVLMDIRMPGIGGIEATERITTANPDIKVLVLTTFDLDEYVYDALRAGASGFLLKDASSERVAMLGGTMTAHPWHWDGFKVTAFLPDTPPADAPGTTRSTDKTTDPRGGTP